jgi:enterochelin esterase-like enzyme
MSERPRLALRKTSKALIVVALAAAGHLYAQQASTKSAATRGEIPHGAIHHHVYTTEICLALPNNRESLYVYTPPGYDPHSPTKYPVLYLLHGYDENAGTWIEKDNIDLFLDSLIAEGKARPMIVVMPASYGNYRIRAWWLSRMAISVASQPKHQLVLADAPHRNYPPGRGYL